MLPAFKRLAPLALMILAVVPAARAADDLVFHPCPTSREQAFIETELKRGPAPSVPDAAAAGGWEYAVVDLDEDGAPEIAVRSIEPCGSAACRTIFYTRIGKTWVAIFETAEREIIIARRSVRGYREILTPTGPFRWSGGIYRPVS
jgi:hypothetical protein